VERKTTRKLGLEMHECVEYLKSKCTKVLKKE
jgi:hypothetical protein